MFVGIEISAAVRALAAEAIDALRSAGVVGRFEAPEKLHVTVAFLGAVAPERVVAVIAALDAVRAARFTFALDRVGAFPNLRRPRIVWLGTRRPQPAFAACVTAVQAAYAALGFAFDRAPEAHPHLTLARLRGPARPLRLAFPAPRPAIVRVDELTLFSSIPQADSTRYEVLHRTALAQPGHELPS